MVHEGLGLASPLAAQFQKTPLLLTYTTPQAAGQGLGFGTSFCIGCSLPIIIITVRFYSPWGPHRP
jgi:hypothetical protein